MGTRKTSIQSSETEDSRSLGQIFHGRFYDAGSGKHVPWMIRCNYCGSETFGECLQEAIDEFGTHMFFGIDTSQEHYEYAAGKRRRAIPMADGGVQ